MAKHTVTLIPGDGIGPEVTNATCKIIDVCGVSVEWEVCDAGASVFKKGLGTGVPKETVDSIIRNKVALKGPLETPVGFGEKSANVTLRKIFETYGNIRPVREVPGVITPYTGRGIDLVIVRENLEDLYAGIEHMQTPGVAQCLKVISRKGCEKIVRLAFEFARSEGRKTVHCGTKANIMKLSEGMLKRTFEEIAPEYPDIEAHHIIIDNCAHQLVKKPEQFDVIVTTNMNGDIISDLSSALIGGLGFAPGANIGDDYAIFEAVHGSAPKYAGKNIINPTAVLLSALMMLRHLGEFEAADTIEHALYVTLSSGVLTRDAALTSGNPASTTQFTDAVIKNLGENHPTYVARDYKPIALPKVSKDPDFVKVKERQVVGVDVFVETTKTPEDLGKSMEALCSTTLFELRFVACRGVKCYPGAQTQGADFVDQARCRFFLRTKKNNATNESILDLLSKIGTQYTWGHVEKLHNFDGKDAFTKPHGED